MNPDDAEAALDSVLLPHVRDAQVCASLQRGSSPERARVRRRACDA
jgi:hypothetical protein